MLKYHWLLIPEPRLWQWSFGIYPPLPNRIFKNPSHLVSLDHRFWISFSWEERFEFEEFAAMLIYYGTQEDVAEELAFNQVWRRKDRALDIRCNNATTSVLTAALEFVSTIEGKCLRDIFV